MKKNYWLYALIPISIICLALIILINKPVAPNDSSSSDTQINIQTPEASASTDKEIQADIQNQLLMVDANRCRGCGKCIMIDSEHFSMSGRLATVTSQNNLSSSNLSDAINFCPEGAISLN